MIMNDTFIYEWHELTKGRKLTVKLILQVILLAVIIGLAQEFTFVIMGHTPDIYHLQYMLGIILVVITVSIISYQKNPVTEVTTSSLTINGDVTQVSRHVITDTGRRFFAVWDSIEITGYKIDEFHRVIQINARWKVSAYKMKGKNVGDYVDSDIRSYPQTILLPPEDFYKALEHLNKTVPDKVMIMTKEEYEKAESFIHKHYTL